MHQILGDNIQKLRKESGLTQEKLAALLGVSFQAVSRWENGVAYPDIELIPRLAFVFGISIDSLLGYQTEKSIQPIMKRSIRTKIYIGEMRFGISVMR